MLENRDRLRAAFLAAATLACSAGAWMGCGSSGSEQQEGVGEGVPADGTDAGSPGRGPDPNDAGRHEDALSSADAPDAGPPTPTGTFLSALQLARNMTLVNAVSPGSPVLVAYDPSGARVLAFRFAQATALKTATFNAEPAGGIGLVKIGANGTVVWSETFDGDGEDAPLGLAVDASSDVWLVGYFKSTTLSFAGQTLTRVATQDPFLVKIAGANGAVLAALDYATPGVGGQCASVAARGQHVVVGCDITGIPSVPLANGGVYSPIFAAGNSNMLFADLDPTTAKARWVNMVGSPGADGVRDVAITPTGEVVVLGECVANSTAGIHDALGTLSVPSGNPYQTVVVAKLAAASGASLWAKSYTGGSLRPRSLAIAPTGEVYFAGGLGGGPVNFGGGISLSTSTMDALLVKLSGVDGSTLNARLYGGSNNDYARAIAFDAAGNLVLTGHYQSSVFTIGNQTLPTPPTPTAFLAKLDGNLQPLWVKHSPLSATGWVMPGSLSIDPASSRISQAGQFTGTVDLGDGVSVTSSPDGGPANAYLVEYAP